MRIYCNRVDKKQQPLSLPVPVPEDREKINRRRRILKTSEAYLLKRYDVYERKKICDDEHSPCPRLVLLYARLGLHRYNFLQGKNLQLSSVKQYIKFLGTAASSYHITLEAMDPALLSFETKVCEESFGTLLLTCRIARPLGICEIKSSPLNQYYSPRDSMPDWPPQNPFQNSNRYYVLNKSELQEKDWIRLYLELAVATTNRGTINNHDLSNLKIVKVAIDTTPQDVEYNLKHVAIFYIRYKDSCEARVGKDVDRVAIVRRAFYENLGCFSLVGQTLSLKIIPKKGKKQCKQFPLSLRLKGLLLSSPRRLKAYKNSGVGLSSRLHKARSTFEYVD